MVVRKQALTPRVETQEEDLDIFGESVSEEAVSVASQEEEIGESLRSVEEIEEVVQPLVRRASPVLARRSAQPPPVERTDPFGDAPRPTPGYKQEQVKGKLVTITGLFKNAKSLGGKTMKRVIAGGSDIAEGTRFVVLLNTYKKKDSDPDYKLFVSEDQ